MANHHDALQLGNFSAKDVAPSTFARTRQSRFNQENVANKQAFANAYSQSLRKQNQTAKNTANGDNPSKHAVVKSDQAQSTRQRFAEPGKHPKQFSASKALKSEESGSKLPQGTVAGSVRHHKAEAGNSAVQQNETTIAQGESIPALDNTAGIDNNFSEFTQVVSEIDVSAVADLSLDPVNPSVVGNTIEQPRYEATAVTANAAGIENILREGSAVGSVLQPGSGQSQLLNPSLGLSVAQENLDPTPLTNPASAALAMQNGNSDDVLKAVGEKPISSVVQLPDLSDPEQRIDSASKTSPLDALLRSAVEEANVKTPLTNTVRANGDANKANPSVADVFAHLNSGQSGREADADTQQSNKQDLALFKDRLFQLNQHNNAPASNATINDLNKLIMQQATSSSSGIDDQTLSDFSVNGAKEVGVSPRLPGNPTQLLSPLFQMSSTLQHKGWGGEVGQRVTWMVNAGLQQAQLQLNPKHLGPIEIKITMSADQQINVNFLTNNSAVKDALDQALPRLREVFDQSGLNLNDVNVRQESHKQHREYQRDQEQENKSNSDWSDTLTVDDTAAHLIRSQSLSSNIVDFYA